MSITTFVPSTRTASTISTVSSVLDGFASTAAYPHHESHTWQGVELSTGFPPLDGLISLTTSTKFEAHIYSAVSCIAYAAMISVYMLSQIALMLWADSAEIRENISESKPMGVFTNSIAIVKGEAMLYALKQRKALLAQVKDWMIVMSCKLDGFASTI